MTRLTASQNHPEHLGRGGFIPGRPHHFQGNYQTAGHPEIRSIGAQSSAEGHVPSAGRAGGGRRGRRGRRFDGE